MRAKPRFSFALRTASALFNIVLFNEHVKEEECCCSVSLWELAARGVYIGNWKEGEGLRGTITKRRVDSILMLICTLRCLPFRWNVDAPEVGYSTRNWMHVRNNSYFQIDALCNNCATILDSSRILVDRVFAVYTHE